MAEVLAYSGTMSAAQQQAVAAYLQCKWQGIGTTGNVLPAGTAVSIASGATLDVEGANQTVDSLNNSNGAGGIVTNQGATPVTLTLAPGSGTSTFSGSIQNGSGSISLAINGSGTQVLAGANTYTRRHDASPPARWWPETPRLGDGQR